MSVHAVEDAFERDPPFGARERRAGTRVDAVAERDVLAGVGAVDAELVWLLRIAAGRGWPRR